MPAATPPPSPAPLRVTVQALPAWARVATGVLGAVARGSLGLIFVAVLLADDPPVTPPMLAWLVLVQVVVPGALGWAVGRSCRAEARVEPGTLVLASPSRRIEVPLASIAAARPWELPLPGPGLALRLASGRRLGWGLRCDDPGALCTALADVGGTASLRDGARHPVAVWAHARTAERTTVAWSVARIALLAVPVGLLLFYTHQHIAYGGPLGQWRQAGFGAWLRTLGVHVGTVAIYLVLWRAVWRGAAEGIALGAAAVAPAQAARVRRGVAWLCGAAYWLGVPAVVAARYLAG